MPGLAASCALLAITASGCTAEGPIDLAACDAPEIYRIDRVELPHRNEAAVALGFDLNEDKVADNQLGFVLGAAAGLLRPFEVTAVTSERLAGEVAWKLAVRSCGEDRTAVSFGRADRIEEVQLVGPSSAVPLAARGGGGELPLSLMFDAAAAVADPGWLPGGVDAIELERSADGARISGKLGIALDAAAVVGVVVPPLTRYFEAHPDQPTYVVERLDLDRDGRITEGELRSSPLIQSLFAPDLAAGDRAALSLGLGLSAVREP